MRGLTHGLLKHIQSEIEREISSAAGDARVINALAAGAVGDGITDDTDAIMDALTDLSNAGGGVLTLPPRVFGTRGGIVPPAYTHIVGTEVVSRYWGHNSTTTPPTTSALKLLPGSSPSAMIAFGSSFTSGSIRDLTLLGNNVGTSVHGITFANPSAMNNCTLDRVSVIGFTGDGIRGQLFASRFHDLFIGGCGGWGMNCPSGFNWTDLWVTNAIITECKLGGVQVNSGGSSGEIHFMGCRFERSGWDNTNILVPLASTSPGLRIAGNLLNASFVDCSTDANSGHGIDIDVASGRSVHHIQFTGCQLNRDGFGDMTNIGEFAAIHVAGRSDTFLERISFTNCTTTEGKADDGGNHPSYVHPKYGFNTSYTTFLSFIGGSVSSGHATPMAYGTGGQGSNFRPLLSSRMGNFSYGVLPFGDTSERFPAFEGGIFVNNETETLDVCFDGSTWTSFVPPGS